MEESASNKSFVQPKTIAELLPSLSGILSKDAMQTLTAKKAPRPTMAITRTTEKVVRPLTIAEMRADLIALKVRSPRTFAKPENSTKKRNWNSSVKLDCKTKSCTGVGQLKENPVRKVLNFQTKATPKSRQTMISTETVKFQKPEARPKKAVVTQAHPVRISGIYKMQETPVVNNRLVKNRMTIANKENNFNRINQKKVHETPKTFIQKKAVKTITPQNISFKSNDDSFLQKEAEINKIEEKAKAVSEERLLENIAEVSPLVSTPFKEYRNLQQFFDNSHENEMENSNVLCNDDTIMSFENIPKQNKRDESVIVSLCDLLNKATVNEPHTKTKSTNTELNDLLEFEKQTNESIKMLESGIIMLTNIKESHIKSLEYVQRLINEKKNNNVDMDDKGSNKEVEDVDKTLVEINPNGESEEQERIGLEKSPVSRPSVIKMKSPSYKIPKKNLCLRKKVFHKSMPNVASKTPTKEADKALDMYLQMKQNMKFLNTPVVKHRQMEQADTPAMTSHNLQKQLDKLFNCS